MTKQTERCKHTVDMFESEESYSKESIVFICKLGEITKDPKTKMYNSWCDNQLVCTTPFLMIAKAALKVYDDKYLELM